MHADKDNAMNSKHLLHRLTRRLHTGSLRRTLSGGALCCIVLIVMYAEMGCNIFNVPRLGGFANSFSVLQWAGIFALSLWYTWNESRSRRLPAVVPEWAALGGFLLMTATMFYNLLPKTMHEEMNPMLHTYSLPAAIVLGGLLFILTHYLTKAYSQLKEEQELRKLERRKLTEMLLTYAEKEKATTAKDEKETQCPVKKNLPNAPTEKCYYYRMLIENKSIHDLKSFERLTLIDECRRHVDPDFFRWINEKQLEKKITARDIIICILIRMHKSEQEIQDILGTTKGTYQTAKSRLKDRLSEHTGATIEEGALFGYLQNLHH